MRPISGVVVSVGPTLDIRLESGQTVHTTETTGLRYGQQVCVNFDYTTQRIRSIYPYVQNADMLETSVSEPIPDVETGDLEDIDVLEGGALLPEGDGVEGEILDLMFGMTPDD